MSIIPSKILIYFKDFKISLLKSIKLLHDRYYLLTILLPILTIIFYAISLPISYDEALTYLEFSSKNIFVSLSYYPQPNNHILHSLITNITHYIFTSFPLLSLRLPSIIISVLTYLFGMYSITKHYNQKISILVIGIVSVLFMNIYYAYMSRGYALVLMCFILSFHFSLNLIKNSNIIRDWVWLTIFSILGFFTIPSYFYVFLILYAFIFIFTLSKSVLVNQIKFASITIISVIFLYLPVIITSGLNSLVNNRFVAPIPIEVVFARLPQFLLDTLELIMGFNAYISLLLVFISLFLLIKNKDWFHTKAFVLFLILPPLLLLIHSVIPFSRTFNYFGFIFILFLCISIHFAIKKVKLYIIMVALIFFQSLLIFNFSNKIHTYEKFSHMANEICSKIVNGNTSYIVNARHLQVYLRYYLKIENISNYKLKYFRSINMDADTIQANGYVIIDRKVDETKMKKPIYSNELFNVYN